MTDYAAALRERQAAYRERYLGPAPDLTPGAAESPPVLSAADYRLNILPGIRSRFWNWFGSADPRFTLQPDFAHLDSVQALTFNLFFPLLIDGVADPRLLEALGIIVGDRFHGHFDAMPDSGIL